VAFGETDEHDEPAVPFDQRGDHAGPAAVEEVAFPVAGHGPVFDFGWSLADVDHGRDVALACRTGLPPGRRALCRRRR
jgi:hypothetical protein